MKAPVRRPRPPGVQERRIFTPPNLSGPSAHQAQVIDALGKLHDVLGDMSGLLARMTPTVLGQKTIVLDSTGAASEQFRLPFGCLSVDYFGATTLTVAAHPLQVAAPGPGAGVAKIGPGGFAVINFKANVASFYGNPGDVLTFTAMAQPQPPTGVVGRLPVVATLPQANPAAGAAFTFINTGVTPLNVVDFRLFFTASAAVANRFISLAVKDQAFNFVSQITNGSAVVAGNSLQVTWSTSIGGFSPGASGNAMLPYPSLAPLPPGWQLAVGVSGIDVADQISQIVITTYG